MFFKIKKSFPIINMVFLSVNRIKKKKTQVLMLFFRIAKDKLFFLLKIDRKQRISLFFSRKKSDILVSLNAVNTKVNEFFSDIFS